MKTILHKATSRGHYDYEWLNTFHTFSFARYYNPDRLNFGALRVLNDDTVKPGKGFGRHPHDNMEIITIPLEGKILHRDSLNHEHIIETGEIQVMSAGTGIFHEEYNGSKTDKVNFLQIWIQPNQTNLTPVYDQRAFNAEDALNKWQLLVSNDKHDALTIHQNATISRVFLAEGKQIRYHIKPNSYGCYLFSIYGNISVSNIELFDRDGVGIYETEVFDITALTDSYLINLEVPQNA